MLVRAMATLSPLTIFRPSDVVEIRQLGTSSSSSSRTSINKAPVSAAAATVALALAVRQQRFVGKASLRGCHGRRRACTAGLVQRAALEAEVQADFVSACSMAKTWEEAIDEVVAAVGTGYEAGFLFVSEFYVDQAQGLAVLMETLREKLDVDTLVGGACGGVVGQPTGADAKEYGGAGPGGDWPPIEVEKGAVLSIGLMRNAGAVPFFIGKGAQGDLELVNRMANEGKVRSLLVLGDPFGPIEEIMRSLDETFPNAVKAGGITAAMQVGSNASKPTFMPSMSICSSGNKARLLSEGVCGLMLTDMEVQTIVCQGCRGAGPAVKVTHVSGPVVIGIGGRPAKEALMYIFGAVDEDTRQKMKEGLLVGLGRPGESSAVVGDGDWLVRGISEVTPNGGLVISYGIEEGQPLRFHVRDRASAEGDLDLMLNRFRLERMFTGSGKEPVGCFLFTCNGRGEDFYGRRHVDARAVARILGDRIGTRVSGFFCNGEIGSPGLAIRSADTTIRSTAVHGFTAVFAMLVPVK